MSIISSSKKNYRQQHDDCGNCEENDTATQQSISTERKKYCNELYTAAGEISRYETGYYGQSNLYEQKKCMFVWTEDNYRRYRNTEICVGAELLQSCDLIKENVGNYIKWGNDLSASLKNIFKSIKDVKMKLGDLRTAAGKLEDCKNDSCHCTQMTILTGEQQKNCDTKPSQDNRPDECNDAKEVLDDLICMPKALGFDADYIFNASSDVIGIQVFSNLGTLDPLQKTLADDAKAFEKHIQDIMKLRESALKKTQEDLVKAVQETTRSAAGLYNKRSDFEGLMCTTKFICCPACNCVTEEDNCKPRLEKCKEDICAICNDVQETFCDDGGCNDEAAAG
ncbi:MAG TPA: hypothetical protein PLR74_05570 [Agriterribacter sp.]|nr:hypothetical protein [Agriterribacter sp.]